MFGRKPKPVKVDMPLMNQPELLKALIKKCQEDLMNNIIQEWIYLQEFIKPTHIGKDQAKTQMAEYQKRVKFLQENLQVYVMYAKEHNIIL